MLTSQEVDRQAEFLHSAPCVEVEHRGGDKHGFCGTVIRLAELAYLKRYGWLNCM